MKKGRTRREYGDDCDGRLTVVMTDRLHVAGVGTFETDAIVQVDPVWDLRAAPQVTFVVPDRDRRVQDNERLARRTTKDIPLGDIVYADHADSKLKWRATTLEPGDLTTVTLEHGISSRLRNLYGPVTAHQGVSLPQFVLSLLSVSGTAPWETIIPEATGIKPPVLDAKVVSQVAALQAERDKQRAPGFASGAKLALQGSTDIASSAQLRVLSSAMSVADDENAGPKATLALVMALIDESDATNLSGGDRDSSGALQVRAATAKGFGIDPRNLADVCRGFLRHGYWRHVPHGAVALARQNPSWTAAQIAQATQGSGTADGSNYARYADNARKIIAAWSGSATTSDTATTTKTAFSVDSATDYWTAGFNFADPIARAQFIASGDVLYWISEATLGKARSYASISRHDQDVIITPGTMDELRRVDKISVSLPLPHTACGDVIGRSIHIADYGASSGDWLSVKASRSSRGDRFIQVDLERPRNALKVPTSADSTVTSSSAGGNTSATATTDVPSKLQRVITFIDGVTAKKYPYLYGGGHTSFAGPYDCSGFSSAVAHVMGVLSKPENTTGFNVFGQAGEGKYVTFWVHETGIDDMSHMYVTINYAGRLRKAEAGGGGSGGATTGWRPATDPYKRPGFLPRHAEGW